MDKKDYLSLLKSLTEKHLYLTARSSDLGNADLCCRDNEGNSKKDRTTLR